jgi:hypothetical protein
VPCEDAIVAGVRHPWFALGLVLLPVAVAMPALLMIRAHAFDGLYGQDAFAYSEYALGPLRDALLRFQAPPSFPLPPGYPLLVALASMVIGPSDALAQAISLIAGASIPLLVALLALELWPHADRRVPLLAGLTAAVAGQLWQSSLVAMPDTPALAASTLGAVAVVRFHRTGRGRWLILGAASLALAVEIRLIYGVVAAALGVLALRRLRADLPVSRGQGLVSAVMAAIVGLAVLAPMVGPIASAVAAGRPVPFLVELGVARFDPLTPFRSSFDTVDGHLAYRLPMAAWYAIQPLQPYWLGVLGLAVPFGLAHVLRSSAWRASELTVLVAWPASMALALVFYPYQNPRFVLGLLPPLAILAACGIAWLWARLPAAPQVLRVATALIAGVLVVNAALAWRHADGFVARQSADLAAIRRLAAKIPDGARVISLGATPVLRHDGRDVVELYYLAVDEMDALASGGPAYLLVDATALEAQWAGTSPGLAFARLRSTPGFAEVDRAGVWTLFVVRG